MSKIALAAALMLGLSGCASIMEGANQPVTIKSVPEGAEVSVVNRAGERIHSGQTPVTLTLKRGAGYFKSESYEVTIKKAGFQTKTLTISSEVNGWYIGNILFGGLIGMLAVDPVTGAMYSFPDTVSADLASEVPKAAQAGALTIVSTADLSLAQMEKARLVGALN